jgi:hypothetical protein
MTAPQTLNYDALKSSRASARGGTWKPRVGVNKVRILPPRSAYLNNWAELRNFAIPYRLHFFNLANNRTEVSRCLDELKQKCPACEAWRNYRKSNDPAVKQRANRAGPSDQYLFNVLDLNNLAAGVQPWAANFSCWDKIMEIGANPSWGNIVHPVDGVDLEITVTAGTETRSGYNSYSVMPVRTSVNLAPVLERLPEWQQSLDELESFITPAKEASEIIALLVQVGLVSAPAQAAAAAPARALAPLTPDIFAARVPLPFAVPTSAPVPTPVPTSVPTSAVVNVASVLIPVSVPAGVHYDPGAEYAPKTEARPVGAPRCYSDYDPRKHRCTPCPVVVECQMALIDSR